jgi:hypothetical protein
MKNIKDTVTELNAYNVEVVEKRTEKIKDSMIDSETDSKTNISEAPKKSNGELKFIKPKAVSNACTAKSPAGVCTVVNSKKNGKRVTFARDIMDCLGNPETVEVCFTEDGIAVGKKLPENGVEFNVKKIGNKGGIYSSQIVQEITEVFDLDFENRVSITFTEAEEYTDDDCDAIINIIMKNPKENSPSTESSI